MSTTSTGSESDPPDRPPGMASVVFKEVLDFCKWTNKNVSKITDDIRKATKNYKDIKALKAARKKMMKEVTAQQDKARSLLHPDGIPSQGPPCSQQTEYDGGSSHSSRHSDSSGSSPMLLPKIVDDPARSKWDNIGSASGRQSQCEDPGQLEQESPQTQVQIPYTDKVIDKQSMLVDDTARSVCDQIGSASEGNLPSMHEDPGQLDKESPQTPEVSPSPTETEHRMHKLVSYSPSNSSDGTPSSPIMMENVEDGPGEYFLRYPRPYPDISKA